MKEVKHIKSEHLALVESQRNQLKSSIVRTYEESVNRDCTITHLELETLIRRFESYVELGGNSYIATLVKKAEEFTITGQPVPEVKHD